MFYDLINSQTWTSDAAHSPLDGKFSLGTKKWIQKLEIVIIAKFWKAKIKFWRLFVQMLPFAIKITIITCVEDWKNSLRKVII